MYKDFKKIIEKDIEELLATKKIDNAINLSSSVGQHFNHNEYPLYFTGDLNAEIVLIHLNPKQKDNYNSYYTGEFQHKTFKGYLDFCSNFGALQYGPRADKKHKSPFDHKQIRFLRPFNVLDFTEDKYHNLQTVIDRKLQLELIPYGSDKFSTKGFTREILEPHFERILDVISKSERKYVLFCGSVFNKLISNKNIIDTHKFKLIKKDGELTKNNFTFSNLLFEHKGNKIKAGLAQSFSQQGIPMEQYGQKCVELYNK